jgi:hypothetical protein
LHYRESALDLHQAIGAQTGLHGAMHSKHPPSRRAAPPCPDDACRAELDRAMRLLRAGKDAAQVVETLSQRLTNKLLHTPFKNIAG